MKDPIQVGCIMYNLVGFTYLAMVLKPLPEENPELGWLWTHREFLSLKENAMGWKGASLYREADTSWLYYLPDEDQERISTMETSSIITLQAYGNPLNKTFRRA